MFVILWMISALPFKYSCRGSVRKSLQAVKQSCWVVMVMRGGNYLQLFVSSLFSLMELGQTEERKLTTSLYWYILKSRSSVCVCVYACDEGIGVFGVCVLSCVLSLPHNETVSPLKASDAGCVRVGLLCQQKKNKVFSWLPFWLRHPTHTHTPTPS